MTSIMKRIHYRFNRLRYRLRWAVMKWTRGYCLCCKWHDECLLDIMVIVGRR